MYHSQQLAATAYAKLVHAQKQLIFKSRLPKDPVKNTGKYRFEICHNFNVRLRRGILVLLLGEVPPGPLYFG